MIAHLCLAVLRFSNLRQREDETNCNFLPSTPSSKAHFRYFSRNKKGSVQNDQPLARLSEMTAVEGLCMKCKTYGPIRDGTTILMKNGRTRMAGFCSQAGCTGKISKIIS
jgi:hypothetical protein